MARRVQQVNILSGFETPDPSLISGKIALEKSKSVNKHHAQDFLVVQSKDIMKVYSIHNFIEIDQKNCWALSNGQKI